MQPVVERFTQTYGQLSAQSLGLLSELYSGDVEFQDLFYLPRRFSLLFKLLTLLPSRLYIGLCARMVTQP